MSAQTAATSLVFRSSTPADAVAAVPLIYSSGPDAFDYVLATRRHASAGFLEVAFVDGAGEFGCRNHVVAECDGRVVAVGAGFGDEAALTFTLAAARQMLRHYGVAAAGTIVRGLRTERVIRPPGRDEWYVAHLGVPAALRGRGIGRRLVEHLLAQGREAGKRLATLDVSMDNPRARALYERMGFAVVAERPSRLANAHGHVPGHYRMALPLH